MTTSDIGEAARIAYAAGVDPIDWAEHEITALIAVHRQIARISAAAGVAPDGDLSEEAMSRRILGLLLNAGWTAPANPMEEL